MNDYLKQTRLLDFADSDITGAVRSHGWPSLSERAKILGIYNFVRDDIKFGFNSQDELPASQILREGYGQCNTKSILFMAFLRSVGIPCRIHGFAVTSDLQQGALDGIWYLLRPKELVHTWVELLYNSAWLNIEGFILDIGYLNSVQNQYKECSGSFCGYGIATQDFRNPPVYWEENDTYIQKEGIVRDFGTYDDPDSFFADHKQQLNVAQSIIYRSLTRHIMNNRIQRLRNSNRRTEDRAVVRR